MRGSPLGRDGGEGQQEGLRVPRERGEPPVAGHDGQAGNIPRAGARDAGSRTDGIRAGQERMGDHPVRAEAAASARGPHRPRRRELPPRRAEATRVGAGRVRPRMMETMPAGLPVPEDDGAASHLDGAEMPPLSLPATDGSSFRVDRPPAGFDRLVLYAYPRTGRPRGTPLTPDWDRIPGAR